MLVLSKSRSNRDKINNKRLNVFLSSFRNVRKWNSKFSNMIKFRSLKFFIAKNIERTKFLLTNV